MSLKRAVCSFRVQPSNVVIRYHPRRLRMILRSASAVPLYGKEESSDDV